MLRERVTVIEVSMANSASAINMTNGKVETALNRDNVEIAALRNEVAVLTKEVAKACAQVEAGEKDLTHLKQVKVDKLQSDLSAIRERLALMEGSMKRRGDTEAAKGQ